MMHCNLQLYGTLGTRGFPAAQRYFEVLLFIWYAYYTALGVIVSRCNVYIAAVATTLLRPVSLH